MKTIILHLGGDPARVATTAWVAVQFPDADVVISSEVEPARVRAALLAAGVAPLRIRWDYEGWDTVSQFTGLWQKLRLWRVRRIVLITDHYQLTMRALRVSRVAYAFRGIDVIGVPHLGGDLSRREPLRRVWLDAARALVWRCTGWLWYERGIRAARRPVLEQARREAMGLTVAVA